VADSDRQEGAEAVIEKSGILQFLNRVPAEKGRRRFRDFVGLAWPIVEPARSFIANWHVDAIADHLQAVTQGKIRRLLITVPPGHGKSLIVSVLEIARISVES
jgi:hypothetical protein